MHLLDAVSIKKVGSWNSSGGLLASKEKSESGVQLRLRFVLADWEGRDF
jgi:hypothetical protein